ncbi:MAG TPA: TlpA disulfide reductase family protein [Thermoanaerobaculia bacterium]|nr:TlpA disulfide reductase family protein [Thermoanaerobaculia bacterium]
MTPLDSGSPFPKIELRDERGGRAPLPTNESLFAFFKTNCPTCEMAWPFLERIRHIGEAGKLQLVAVSQDEPPETREFNRRLGVRVYTLYDPSPWRASETLGLSYVPTFLLIGSDGVIRDSAIGFQKQKMEAFAGRAAALAGRTRQPLFRPGENVPGIKPG